MQGNKDKRRTDDLVEKAVLERIARAAGVQPVQVNRMESAKDVKARRAELRKQLIEVTRRKP
jgi:hypothetical protein